MARYAIHSGGFVTNLIEADSIWIADNYPTADLVEPGVFVGPGFTRVSAGVYTAPVVADPPDPPDPNPIRRWVTKLAFRQRFSAIERATITYAARQASPEARASSPIWTTCRRPHQAPNGGYRRASRALEAATLLAAGARPNSGDPVCYDEEYRG
jgi:hypothetical protein